MEILGAPRLGQSDGFLVGIRESDLLGEVVGDVVRWSKQGCCLVQRTGTGLMKCGMGVGLGHWPVGCLEVPKLRLLAHFYHDAHAEG